MTVEGLPDENDETFFELITSDETLLEADRIGTAQIEADDDGADEFSIEQLGAAYARVMRGDDLPAKETVPDDSTGENSGSATRTSDDSLVSDSDSSGALDDSADDACCPVSELSVLEAALFVGAPEGTKLTARKLASIMREVSPKEIRGFVAQLNVQYVEQNSAFHIVSKEGAYSLELISSLENLRDGFLGEVREIKLPQTAIDVLAIVAYHQPVTRQEVDRIWQRPSGALLKQLVQRNLLAIDSDEASAREKTFVTTSRFLKTLGLESLQDLPQTAEASEVDDF